MKRAAAVSLLLASCTQRLGDARELEIANVLARSDETTIRARPALIAGKYVRMAGDPVSFVRGSLAVYRHDVRDGATFASASAFALDTPLVPSLGDAHPENFGTLLAADGTFALEPNDFDAADYAPYLWDVRRLAAGLALAAARSNEGDDFARAAKSAHKRAIARNVAAGYVRGLDAILGGAPGLRVTATTDNAILADLFKRSRRDLEARQELVDMTVLEGGTRRLKRGVIDPTDSQNTFADLPANAVAALGPALERYRTTLPAPPHAEYFQVLDAAREFGSGVASWPKVRVVVLVRGPRDATDDDVLLEVKELGDSGIAGLVDPGVYHNGLSERIISTTRHSWARPDAAPMWSATEWLGLPVQVRAEVVGQKSVRISRMVGERGTVDAVGGLASILGEILARVHASATTDDAYAIRARIGGDGAAFCDEQAEFASSYVDLQLEDFDRFNRSLRRLGPRFAIPVDPADAPSADFTALLGSPPPPPVLP